MSDKKISSGRFHICYKCGIKFECLKKLNPPEEKLMEINGKFVTPLLCHDFIHFIKQNGVENKVFYCTPCELSTTIL